MRISQSEMSRKIASRRGGREGGVNRIAPALEWQSTHNFRALPPFPAVEKRKLEFNFTCAIARQRYHTLTNFGFEDPARNAGSSVTTGFPQPE